MVDPQTGDMKAWRILVNNDLHTTPNKLPTFELTSCLRLHNGPSNGGNNNCQTKRRMVTKIVVTKTYQIVYA